MSSCNANAADRSIWPWSSILFFGMFDLHTVEARRYQRRTAAAFLSLFVLLLIPFAMSAAGIREMPGMQWLLPVALGGVFAVVARELWTYVSSLDEMARTLQLQAMSLTYLAGLPIFVAAHFVGGATGW